MTTWLYLTAEGSAEPSGQWPCCLVSTTEAGPLLPLAEAAAAVRGQGVELVLPMEMCSWLLTDTWPTRRRPTAQAVAFAIEEHLSEDLEALHLCAGARDHLGRYGVWVINRQRLAGVLALVAELGISVERVQVDADRLPNDQPYGVWWLGRWILGGALETRLALSACALAQLKSRLPADTCWRDDGHPLLHAQAATHQPTDLLQGAFAGRRRGAPWIAAAFCVVVSFTLAWGFMQARSGFYEEQAHSLYAMSEQRFRALYPQQTRIVDLPAQFKALQQRGGASPHETQVGRLLTLSEQVIGASSVDVQRIEYRQADGWKLQLTADSFAQLEQLRERGQASGLPIRLGSASKVQTRVQALLTLEPAS